MSEQEAQTRGYKWWQWMLGVLTFWPMIAMLVGTLVPSTRSSLTPKRIWIGYAILAVVGIISLVALAALVGSPEQASVSSKTQTDTFTCEDQMQEYKLLSPLGHQEALDRIAKGMNERASSDFFRADHAATLLEDCISRDMAGPTPVSVRKHPLVEEFGCQWIMDNYRPMAMMGRDGATMHVSNSMNAKRMEQGVMSFNLVTVGDAAAALRECEAQGFQ